MRHRPTGLEVRCRDERSQHRNRAIARQVLEGRVSRLCAERGRAAKSDDRARQVGSGQRGDKIRTYRVRDDVVADHRSGRKMRLRDVLSGCLPVA